MEPHAANEEQEVIYRNGTNGNQKYFNIATSVFLPVIGWLLIAVLSLTNFQAATEANRFTSSDGSRVYERLAAIESRPIPKIPPDWLLKRIDSIEDRVLRIENAADTHIATHHDHSLFPIQTQPRKAK